MNSNEILLEVASFKLPALPFSKDALSPLMSEETFNYHFEKHHQTYINNLNNLIKGTEFETKNLGEIIKTSQGGIFNNAAQVFNHTFFWYSMKQNGGGVPTGKMLDLINSSFGSFETFKTEFKNAGLTQFGSGWAWLVFNTSSEKLEIVKTANAETPITNSILKPLITVDVWEHAYYIDYRNDRGTYLETFINKLINWDFALNNL
jgi:superoxide dismutase, Fe-Mn family